jgi:DNA repair protein RadC
MQNVSAPHATLRGLPPEQRPREKLLQLGASPLSNEELLAVVLGRGLPGKDALVLAREVIAWLDSLADFPEWKDLRRIRGIGPGKACQILAAVELSRRFLTRRARVRINKPMDALPFLANLRGRRQECFAALTLDAGHQVIRLHEITVGLANQSQVHPRETFACALEDRAVGLIIAHNHPSGSLQPSVEDLTTTRRLAEAGRVLGIPLLDHLIVGEEGFVSLREKYADYFSSPSPLTPLPR